MAIKTCRDKRTAWLVAGERVPEFEAIGKQVAKAIARLQNAPRLIDLMQQPSNRFHALEGDRKGQYSIRVNSRWRLCFRWELREPNPNGDDPLLKPGDAYDVELVDYH